MQPRNEVASGYALLGLTIGLLLFPWIYLVGVRTELLTLQDPVSATFLVAIILAPAVVGYVIGRSKGERAST